MRRVAVIGGSCTGKTTLSRALAARLEVACVELDALHHGPNWTEAPAEVLRERVDAALAAAPDGWVADGTYYAKLGPSVLARADTVVWLDLPFRIALRRVLWRTLRRGIARTELWNGNRETLRLAFTRQSIVWWVVRSHRRQRQLWPDRLAALEGVDVIRLVSPRAVRRWLDSVG